MRKFIFAIAAVSAVGMTAADAAPLSGLLLPHVAPAPRNYTPVPVQRTTTCTTTCLPYFPHTCTTTCR